MIPRADRPVVVVLMGGPDAERDVSLMSGREVAAALRRTSARRCADGEPTSVRPSLPRLCPRMDGRRRRPHLRLLLPDDRQ